MPVEGVGGGRGRDSLFIVCVYANLRINLQNMTAHVKRPFSQGRRLARDVGGDRSGPKIFFSSSPQMAKFGGGGRVGF